MIRRITWLASAIVVLALVSAVAFAMEPWSERSPILYQVTMDYGGFGPAGPGRPGMGLSDNLYHGTASAQLELVGNTLVVQGSYARLTGPILADVAEGIHIHHDPAAYHLDTIVAGLQNEGRDEGAFGGSVYLTNGQVLMLVEGRLYMDVHTTAFPEGELRGMIVPALVQAPEEFMPLGLR